MGPILPLMPRDNDSGPFPHSINLCPHSAAYGGLAVNCLSGLLMDGDEEER